MSKRHKFKAREKSVQRMTRDGLVQEERSTGKVEHLSTRTAEVEFHHGGASGEEFSIRQPSRNPSSQTDVPITPPGRKRKYADFKTNTVQESCIENPAVISDAIPEPDARVDNVHAYLKETPSVSSGNPVYEQAPPAKFNSSHSESFRTSEKPIQTVSETSYRTPSKSSIHNPSALNLQNRNDVSAAPFHKSRKYQQAEYNAFVQQFSHSEIPQTNNTDYSPLSSSEDSPSHSFQEPYPAPSSETARSHPAQKNTPFSSKDRYRIQNYAQAALEHHTFSKHQHNFSEKSDSSFQEHLSDNVSDQKYEPEPSHSSTPEGVHSSSHEHIPSSSPEHIQSSFHRHAQSSFHRHAQSFSHERAQSPSPEHAQSSPPERAQTETKLSPSPQERRVEPSPSFDKPTKLRERSLYSRKHNNIEETASQKTFSRAYRIPSASPSDVLKEADTNPSPLFTSNHTLLNPTADTSSEPGNGVISNHRQGQAVSRADRYRLLMKSRVQPKANISAPPLKSALASDDKTTHLNNGISLNHRQEKAVHPVNAEKSLTLSSAVKKGKAIERTPKPRLAPRSQTHQDLHPQHKKGEMRLSADETSVIADGSIPSRKRAILPPTARTKIILPDKSKNTSSAQPITTEKTVSSGASSTAEAIPPRKKKKLKSSSSTKKKKSRLRFDSSDTSAVPAMAGKLKKQGSNAAHVVTASASSVIHGKFHEVEKENASLESLHYSELLAEHGTRRINRAVKSRRGKNQGVQKKSRLQESPAATPNRFKKGTPASTKKPEHKKSAINRFYQKLQNKKRAADAAKAAKKGTKTAGKTAGTATTLTQRSFNAVKQFFTSHKRGIWIFLAILLALILLLSQLQSCTTMALGSLSTVSASSWPADDNEITAADVYYTQLEANLQYRIDHLEEEYSGYDEYNYNLGEIGHDPVALISYLCAKYGTFTFNQVKPELDALFALQYGLDVQTLTEERTVTKTVSAGESLGTVVTSAYCNCSICCGQWAGGPTASGVYPTANHTIAVDASNPTVPLGTEIIMNGTLYKVEDTGAFDQYGVDFDVYFDSHDAALAWGHRSFEAFYAGGDGSNTIEVTTTEEVHICNASLTSRSLPFLFTSRMNSDQQELYTVYQSSRGNRQFLGSPFSCNWYGNVSSFYGYRVSPTSGQIQLHKGLDIAVPQGTEILAVHDGTVTTAAYDDSYGNYIVLENDKGYTTKYAHCSSLSVSTGQEVTKGDVIAAVGSTGNSTGPHLHIEFLYQGDYLNPYFYLGVGQGSAFGNGFGFTGDVDALDDATFAALIQEAEKYLGMPYVWGGSNPSTGFDCSGFVSYVFTNSGVYNMGRLTAQGIYDISSPVNPADAKPGDIIFFQGTYNTSGASHVGIYVGNGQMIHCGDPIQYTSINTPYWQSHFLGFGRVTH